MKKLFKLLLWVGGLFIILIIGVAVTLVYLDPNDYKGFITTKVEDATGRDFALSGDIKLSYYPWLGIEVDGMTLGNAKGFGKQPFLHTDQLKLRVKTVPLLRKQIEMDTINIKGARISLAKNKKGITNWDDLVAEKTEEAEPFPLAALVLGGVNIQNASLRWDDQAAGVNYQVTDLNFTTGELVLGQPIDLKMSLNAEASKPKIAGHAALNGTVSYNLDDQHYILKPLEFSAVLKGKNIPGGQTDLKLSSAIDVNLDSDTATVSDLVFDVLDTHVDGNIVASEIQSGKPTVKGSLHVKGKDLAQLFKAVEVEPLASQLATLKDRSFDLNANLDVDMARNDLDVSGLTINILGAAIKGDVHGRNIQSETPAIKGKLTAKGPDLPTLIQIAGQFEGGEKSPLKSVGKHLAGMKNKAFDVATEFDADLKVGTVNVPSLSIQALGINIAGDVTSQQDPTKASITKGKLKATGPDLPLLLQLAGYFEQGDSPTLGTIGKNLSKTKNKGFDFETEFDADLKAGSVNVPSLSIKTLGINVSGNLVGKEIQTETPAVKGKLKATGPDLPLLIQMVGQGEGPTLKNLDKQLSNRPDKGFDIATEFDADLKAGSVNVPSLSIKTLGINVSGNLTGKEIQTETPAAKGKLKATGPDLPLLLQLAGTFEQGDSNTLGNLGKQLSGAGDKGFNVDTQFDVDLKSGQINIPGLVASTLGITVTGKLKGENIDSAKGKMDGQLSVKSDNLTSLLKAVDQAELAEVLKSVSIDAGISGNKEDLNLKPLGIKATLAGKQIPNSPVDVALNAATQVNLKKQTLTLNSLSLNGLGLDVKGNLNATQIIDAPAFDGNLAISPFNLRQLMKQLNQKPPVTADNKVFRKVALQTTFSGTKTSIDLKKLALVLDDTQLKGDLSVKDFINPDIQFGIGIDKLNADRYLPPSEENKKGTSKKGKAVKPVTPETTAAGTATELPIDTLRALKIKGDLLIGELIISNARLKDVQFSIDAKDGKIKLAPIAANLYKGKYDGDIFLDATGKLPKLTLNTTLKGIQAEPLLKDVMGEASLVGTGDFNLAVIAAGSDVNQLKKTLNGKGMLRFTNGILRGVDVRNMLEQAEIMLESKRIGKIKKGGETQFDQLTGTFDITSGVVNNQDLLLTAPGFKVPGKGMLVNLNDMTWKYDLKVAVVEASATRGEENYNLGGYEIPIKCRGKVDSKNCVPDLGGLLAAAGEKMVEDKFKDFLNKKLGVGDKQPEQPAGTEANPTQPKQTESAPTGGVEEELGKFLKKLPGF
jgi:AsmA protein